MDYVLHMKITTSSIGFPSVYSTTLESTDRLPGFSDSVASDSEGVPRVDRRISIPASKLPFVESAACSLKDRSRMLRRRRLPRAQGTAIDQLEASLLASIQHGDH
jgi:hypothetical protein